MTSANSTPDSGSEPPPSTSGSVRTLASALQLLNPWPNIRVMGSNVGPDVMAGITVAIIALPLALAFGVASGLGPEAGMWAAICGGLVVGLFGGSRIGVSGPTGPKVIQLAVIVEATRLATGEVDASYVFGLVFLSGLVCLVLGMLRVGRFIYYVPYSAVSGFMCGIGLIIILLEIPPMLGFETPSSVMEAIKSIPYDVMHEDWRALLISGSTFFTILLWPRLRLAPWLPGPLMGLLVGTGIAMIGKFDVATIGAMPQGLPALHIPEFGMITSRFSEMIGPAAALAGLCIFDSLLTCLVADTMTDQRHDSDREIVGQGLANLACGLVGGVTTATATMRTVANAKCGAQTGLASIVHGVVLLALMLGLAPLASHVPMACLAGILLKVGFDIIDYRVLPVLHRMPAADALCFWSVLGLTVTVDLLVAMGVGIAIAFIRAVHELGNLYEPRVLALQDAAMEMPIDKELPEHIKGDVLKLRLQGPLFFGIADAVYRTISELKEYRYLIVRLKDVPMVDMSGAYLLDDLLEKARRQGATVMITGMEPKVRQRLEHLKIIEKLGPENCFDHFSDAITRICELEEQPLPISA